MSYVEWSLILRVAPSGSHPRHNKRRLVFLQIPLFHEHKEYVLGRGKETSKVWWATICKTPSFTCSLAFLSLGSLRLQNSSLRLYRWRYSLTHNTWTWTYSWKYHAAWYLPLSATTSRRECVGRAWVWNSWGDWADEK